MGKPQKRKKSQIIRIIFRVEIVFFLLLVFGAVLFSIDFTREFMVESVLEKQYSSLAIYKKMASYLNEKRVKARDLKYVILKLKKLKKKDFILHSDLDLRIADAYERLGDFEHAEELLTNSVRTSKEMLSRADALLQLAALYQKTGKIEEAVDLLEQNQKLYRSYRTRDYYLKLSHFYYSYGKIKDAGRTLVLVGSVNRSDRKFYRKVVSTNWAYYDRKEQSRILGRLASMRMFSDYAVLAANYIYTYHPEPVEVENLVLELTYRSHRSYVKHFLKKLSLIEEYKPIYREMRDLYNLAKPEINSHSGKVRGVYYYRKLSYLDSLRHYSARKARLYHSLYLKGDVDLSYLDKNLTMVIRNFLAYHRYAWITNAVESSYAKIGYSQPGQVLDSNISFWNAYAHERLGDFDRSFVEYENAIAKRPDGYFAFQARGRILSMLKTKKVPLEEYLSKLEYRYLSNSDAFSRLHYAKVLYAFRKGYGRTLLRKRIVELASRFSDNPLLTYDQELPANFKMSENYIRFLVYTRYGFHERAKSILSLSGITDPKLQNILLLKELIKVKDFRSANHFLVSMGKNRFLNDHFSFLPDDLKMLFYPRPYDSEIELSLAKMKKKQVDKYLIYAIIRGESMYIPRIRSRVGARGLMQLMPSTARLIAPRVLGRKNVNLYHPLNNILLGSRYLNDNIKSYGFLSAIAAYNGGYTVIRRTRERFHPRNDLELMEIIPYHETRFYVRKIISNYERYREIYDRDHSDLMIAMLPRK